jgi:hypothetical protein
VVNSPTSYSVWVVNSPNSYSVWVVSTPAYSVWMVNTPASYSVWVVNTPVSFQLSGQHSCLVPVEWLTLLPLIPVEWLTLLPLIPVEWSPFLLPIPFELSPLLPRIPVEWSPLLPPIPFEWSTLLPHSIWVVKTPASFQLSGQHSYLVPASYSSWRDEIRFEFGLESRQPNPVWGCCCFTTECLNQSFENTMP